MESSLHITTTSSGQTRELGKKLGERLGPGAVVGLIGPLGSGKTCFVQGMAEGLTVDPEEYVKSPSFTIVNEYRGRTKVFHIDLYRILSPAETDDIGLSEYIHGDGVSIIEWADRIPDALPDEHISIRFEHVDLETRSLTFTCRGQWYGEVLDAMV